jgi:quercetin dioxygenase-like cupin family protein
MRIVPIDDVEAKPVTDEGARGTTVRWLLEKPEGAPNFAMRLFEVSPGGSTPLHEHGWEHEVFVLEGVAEVVTAEGATPAAAGSAVLILPGERHQFRNTGPGVARFLCMIPLAEDA